MEEGEGGREGCLYTGMPTGNGGLVPLLPTASMTSGVHPDGKRERERHSLFSVEELICIQSEALMIPKQAYSLHNSVLNVNLD